MASRRVGIFGGTFDPPHIGHLVLAETIRDDFALDEILFVPSNEPPHKAREDLTPATHRYAMVVAATLQNPAFTPSAVEVNRPGKSYSIETVKLLQQELDGEVELFFLTGLDSFLEIETWRDWEELLEQAHFVVVSRPPDDLGQVRERLPERYRERLVMACGDDPSQTVREAGPGLRIFLSDAVRWEVSSTEIRERVRQGRSIRYRVSAEVRRYIDTHGLYSRAAVREAVS